MKNNKLINYDNNFNTSFYEKNETINNFFKTIDSNEKLKVKKTKKFGNN